jgi:hypothetical protein
MIATVIRIRRRGVEFELTDNTSVNPGDRFQIFRIVDGQTVVIGVGVVWKVVSGKVRLNPEDPNITNFNGAQVGDSVQSL